MMDKPLWDRIEELERRTVKGAPMMLTDERLNGLDFTKENSGAYHLRSHLDGPTLKENGRPVIVQLSPYHSGLYMLDVYRFAILAEVKASPYKYC